MEVSQKSLNVHVCTFEERNLSLFFGSDIHYDSRDCHRELLKKHLKHIQENNGYAFLFGDLLDVMGCFGDRRAKGSEIRSEYLKHDKSYLDLVIEDLYEFLKPFKENIAFISYGNHETAIIKHRDTDPIDRIVFALNQAGSPVCKGGYEGYIVFNWAKDTRSQNLKLAYHHGYGGAQRSKGVLNSQMMFMKYRDADIIVSGHDHNKIHDPSNVGYLLDQKFNIKHKRIDWLKLGSYKRNDKNPGIGGWTVEKGFLPKAMGGWFCDLNLLISHGGYTRIEPTFTDAK